MASQGTRGLPVPALIPTDACPTMELVESKSPPPSILVIDDDPLVTVVVRRAMEGMPCTLHSEGDAQGGLDAIPRRRPDLIVLDNLLPDAKGVDILPRVHELAPAVPVLFVTASGSGSTAIEAMKLSAFDYLPKPLDPRTLRGQVRRALEQRDLERESDDRLISAGLSAAPEPLPDSLVGECRAMQSVFKAVGRVAPQDVAVLICGEHGTGKEAIAREIHKHSGFANGPVVKLQCLGATEGRSLEEDLFGMAGAPGLLEAAAGGSLLLKEVTQLPLSTQGKLLQVLRDGAFRRAGESALRPVECRVIAISSTPLDSYVSRGVFRSDLYYALGSFVITLPPLRQRRSDLPLLVAHLLESLKPITQRFGVTRPRVSADAMEALCEHLWPGNIDELEAVLKRALVEQKGHILMAADLRETLGTAAPAAPSDTDGRHFVTDWTAFSQFRMEGGSDTLHADAVEEMERKLFARVLIHTEGNQAQAARILGITRASLRKRLRQYHMSAKQPDPTP